MPPSIKADEQIVAGAGPSTEICKLFFEKLNQLDKAKSGYNLAVKDSSVKHKGGILNSEKFLFGRTGRPLARKEKALGKDQIFLAKGPISFAKGLEVDLDQTDMSRSGKYIPGILPRGMT